jgi:hypothetical protein
VAPLDFFTTGEGELRFHDLAVDLGLTGRRAYDVVIRSDNGRRARARLDVPAVPFDRLGTATMARLEISIHDSRAKSAEVVLTRSGSGWAVTRVRHG